MNVVSNTNSRQNVSFPSVGDTAHGYLALPESGSGPGLIDKAQGEVAWNRTLEFLNAHVK